VDYCGGAIRSTAAVDASLSDRVGVLSWHREGHLRGVRDCRIAAIWSFRLLSGEHIERSVMWRVEVRHELVCIDNAVKARC
jgi:hypothetical protein